MRHSTRLAVLGLSLLALAPALAEIAAAQSRRLPIEVRPRSWLDAGKVVPVGSMQGYVTDQQGAGFGGPGFGGARYSNQGLLPDRFSGGQGRVVVDIPAPDFLRGGPGR